MRQGKLTPDWTRDAKFQIEVETPKWTELRGGAECLGLNPHVKEGQEQRETALGYVPWNLVGVKRSSITSGQVLEVHWVQEQFIFSVGLNA